ncbi:unnamed protein product [marine sediment metagenome]|uniref:Uncharacterized protein n=1 Tax=marine sediment metagenome TaxID=412755 RepID=X1D030_9ZZZZ
MYWLEDQKAWILANEYNFSDEEDTKFEPFVIDAENWVFRIAQRSRSNNIMIKFDPDQVT